MGGESLIILDGWSKCGTYTMDIVSNDEENDDDKKQQQPDRINSTPKERNILKYHINDTVHIKLGRGTWGTDIVLNPKPCIVCCENARVIRLKCGHQVLCHQCYDTLKEDCKSNCPICRT